MPKPNYDDPAVEKRWSAARRAEVSRYLRAEGVPHGRVPVSPAWLVAPYVSVWAVEGKSSRGSVWVICGDLPTDYIPAEKAKNPREAVRGIARLWLKAVPYMKKGKSLPTFRIGDGTKSKELAPRLESRAKLLLAWVKDPSCWEDPDA